jgi:hypothetical protein
MWAASWCHSPINVWGPLQWPCHMDPGVPRGGECHGFGERLLTELQLLRCCNALWLQARHCALVEPADKHNVNAIVVRQILQPSPPHCEESLVSNQAPNEQ